jgi:hypothetical protein
MARGIFLIQQDGQLVEMNESPYDSEAILQELLAKYPSLIAGDEVDTDNPRRWLLVKRELGIPSAKDAGNRWSVDHLLLDQDGIPTLVEVKRSTDTRIRREVVGQMLDYAANAVAYWPAERLQLSFESTAKAAGLDSDSVLREFLGPEGDPGRFWSHAKTNLQAGRLRLIFVADDIPLELRRVIEFLNQQMDPTEVLGVEIRQFAGLGLRSLVPRIIGQTAGVELRKGSSSGKQWDEASVFEVFASRGATETAVARRLMDWARARDLRIWWGKGVTDGSFYPLLDHAGRTQYTFAVRTGAKSGYVQLQFPLMTAPFDQAHKQRELLDRLRDHCGWQLDSNAKYPSCPFATIANAGDELHLLEVFDWVIDETRRQRLD